MDYNNNDKKKNEQNAAFLAMKLSLEAILANKLLRHFKQVGNFVKNSYVQTSKLPSFYKHKEIIQQILKDHYITTAGKFSDTIRSNFQPVTNNEKVQALIDANIENNAINRSEFAADSIANTTKDNFQNYIKETIADAATDGKVLSIQTIANHITNKFNDDIPGRIDDIKITETGTAESEGAQEEIDALNDIGAQFEDGTNIDDYEQYKTWMAILDDKTRDAHAEADGQTVAIDEPYEVGGEKLMYPCDDSLGASAGNIINCRCTSVISLKDK